MKFISLFAGVGGFDMGVERAGMECALQVEIDKHARAVLRERWPGVPKLEDVHDVGAGEPVHLVCGGFPCQDYSVAGTRSGLAGDRGALWWEFHRIIAEFKPTWVVGENVPGLLSSAGGRDFRTIIGSLVQLGYGVTWAVLDSQYFGVAQRRRRLFIVAHSGGEPRPEILAISEGLFGHPAPSREAGEGATPILEVGARTGKSTTDPRAGCGIGSVGDPSYTLQAGKQHGVMARSIDFQNTTTEDEICGTLQAEAQRRQNRGHGVMTMAGGQARAPIGVDVAPTLNLNHDGAPIALKPGHTVPRRLTPLECERLQAFPDHWTEYGVDDEGKRYKMSDTQRYKQMGNAVTVNVIEYIARRIMEAT